MSEAAASAQVEAPLVLVADDDPDILRLVARHLTGAGYRVARACDGAEALELARSLRPDLVVLDVAMPHADGHAVCRELQKDGPGAPRSSSSPLRRTRRRAWPGSTPAPWTTSSSRSARPS